MGNYKGLYLEMFNAATDANRRLIEISILAQQASLGIIKAQQDCEGRYIDSAEDEP